MDISSMLEVQVKEMKTEVKIKENVTPRVQAPRNTLASIPFSREEESYYQLVFGTDIASVRYRRIHCTACDVHIGSAPSQAHNMLEHPVLRTLLCEKCHEFYGDGSFEQGDDATDMFCRWCANGGNLYCCSYCSNTFCYKCIRRNFASLVRKKIEADEKWQCFVCNPNDLYDTRALCRALLRHVQTVTSLLQSEKNMSAEEIEEKMNLDESECCPRRNKRRQKRKHDSNSEDEDETYVPKINGVPVYIPKRNKKYKKHKPRYCTTNGANRPVRPTYPLVPIKPRPTSLPGNHPKESQSQFSQQSQFLQQSQQESVTNIEQREAAVEPSESIVSPPSTINLINSSMPTRYESSTISSTLYHTALMNRTAASSTYIRPAVINSPVPFHPIILPPQPISMQNSYQQPSQPLRNTANAMVTISNPIEKCYRPQLIFPQVRNSSDVTLTPNIIELDSDSDDEPRVVGQRNNPNNGPADMMDLSDKIIPVALFSTENDAKEDQPLKEMRTTLKKQPVSFNDIMLTHSQEIDRFLGSVKENMHNFFTLSDNEVAAENSESTTYGKIKRFHQSIRETVFQLAHINDRIIREYNKWERSQTRDETETPLTKRSTVIPQKDVDIPLKMTCVNESDADSDDDEESECQVMEPSAHIESSKILQDLLLFKKNVKHHGVGDSIVSSEDKGIQVYEVVSRDYEKCIGYSLLTKADYDEDTSENVMKPEKVLNENFDKYQEQFIFYLQHIEDHGIKTEDVKGLEDPNLISNNEFIETDLSCTSEIQQNIDLLIETAAKSENCYQEESSKSLIDSITYVMPTDITDCEKKIDQVNDDTDFDNKITDVRPTDEFRKIKLPKLQNSATTLNNDDAVSSNKNTGDAVCTEAAVKETEENCTLIDN